MLKSEKGETAKRESVKELAMQVCTRLDGLLGFVEWIKTNMVRKGGHKHLKDMDELSVNIEKISRKMESLSKEDERMDDESLDGILEYDRDILVFLSEIESAVKRFGEKKVIPQSDEVETLLEKLGHMEERIRQRASILRGFSG